MLRNAALASPAVLTPERRADHASNTEVRLVELPEADEIINDSLLLRNAIQFRHEAWIVYDACCVEIGGEAE